MTTRPVNPEVDIGLAALCKHRAEGETFTHKDIADVCGVTKSGIYFLELTAWQHLMKKIQCDPELKKLLPNIRKPKYHRG